jgi:hypothetical protein
MTVLPTTNVPTMHADVAIPTIARRLERCYSGPECAWELFYQPRWERANFATRYHLVYPALAYFIQLKQNPRLAQDLRPKLDTMYRGLLDPRCWTYWHSELNEAGWPLQERNLTFAGRLATFVGFYIEAFGMPPAERIELESRSTTYAELSESLWHQMTASPTGGVTCYRHESMTQCNAHLLINNVLHDRLFGTRYAAANDGWLGTLEANLLTRDAGGALFYFGTESASCAPAKHRRSLGIDIWTLFLMSAVIPDRVRLWFADWRSNILHTADGACVAIDAEESKAESSSTSLATAWTFCLARELGESELADALRATLLAEVEAGFELDPLLSGLYLLGDSLQPGAFRQLVQG